MSDHLQYLSHLCPSHGVSCTCCMFSLRSVLLPCLDLAYLDYVASFFEKMESFGKHSLDLKIQDARYRQQSPGVAVGSVYDPPGCSYMGKIVYNATLLLTKSPGFKQMHPKGVDPKAHLQSR